MPRLFLGAELQSGARRSIELERHAVTFAGSGSGKGACQITPNLFEWPESVVVVDPKGEAAKLTAEHRADVLGQQVAVLDPFGYAAGVPDRLRASVNPLDLVAYSEDLQNLADGLIHRTAHDPQPFFDNTAHDVAAGLLAYLLEAPSLADRDRNLAGLLDAFQLARAEDAATFTEMGACTRFGGMAARIGSRLLNAEKGTKNALESLETHLRWLSSERMNAWLRQPSTVDLHQLKRGTLSVYLVIPFDKLDGQRVFLRLFVAAMLRIMWEKMPDGAELGTRCLFVLDEFPALGQLEALPVSALPGGRSFGLHVWPFCQYWGQLVDVYGQSGAVAFLASADAVCVYGVDDDDTPRLVSGWFGDRTADDIELEGVALAALAPDDPITAERARLVHSTVNRPRLPADELTARIGKHEGDTVAREMVVKLRGGRLIFLRPSPYFAEAGRAAAPPPATAAATPLRLSRWLGLNSFVVFTAAFVFAKVWTDIEGLALSPLPEIWFGLVALWGAVLLVRMGVASPN